MIRTLALSALFSAMGLLSASAEDTSPQSGWQTTSRQDSCFTVLYPEASTLKELRSPKAYVAVTHSPSEGIIGAISLVSGLEVEDIKGVADIDGKIFELLTYEKAGYVSSGQREADLLAAMIAGKEMKVTWTGPEVMITQDYKLAGLGKAKATIDIACAVTAK